MDTFLLQVSDADLGYPNIRDNRRYDNPSWASKRRDRAHGEVKVGDTLLVYCTKSAIENGKCLAFSVKVRGVSEDNVTLYLDEPQWFTPPIHRPEIIRLVDEGRLPDDFSSYGSQGFNIAKLGQEAAQQALGVLDSYSQRQLPPGSSASPLAAISEADLEEWLVENWGSVNFGRPLKLYEEDGEPAGQQYDTKAVGRIDLLCEDTISGALVVIELKRGRRQSDAVLGQLARYMGWVKEHMANGRSVEGIILTPGHDERLRYAVKAVPGASVMRYETRFEVFPEEH